MEATELSFKTLAENTQDGIFVNYEQGLVFANRSMEEILGYSPGELLGTNLDDIIASDPSEQGGIRHENNNPPLSERYETRFKRKDNSICSAEITATITTWRGKRATAYIVRDISLHKRQEEALRETEHRFLQLTQNINEVFFIRDLQENKMIYISPAYEKIWQRPISTIYENALAFMEHIHPEDKDRIQEVIQKRNQIREGFSTYQYRIIWPNGEVRWIRARTFPISDKTGRPDRVAGIAEDITEQKLAEDKLGLSEMQLRQIIDLVPYPLFVKDGEGRFLIANKATAGFYGMSVDEITGSLQRDLMPHEKQLERILSDDKIVMETNVPKQIREEELLDATNHRYVFNTTKIPFVVSNHEKKAVLGVAIDITECKDTEAALRLSEERLRRSLHYANIGVWDWNIQSGALYWSARVAPLFGRDPNMVVTSYSAFLDMLHPDDRHLVENAINICIQTGQDYDIEHRALWPDGSIHWFHELGGVIYNASGKAERMLGVVRDITRRKLAEESLSKSEKKYRAVMENASDAILLGTMDGQIIDVNHRAEEMFGYTRNELLRMHAIEIHPKEDHPTLMEAFHDLATKGSSLYEHLGMRKDGSIFNVEVAATVIEYHGEKVVVGIFRDTTARKQAEKERMLQAKEHRDTLVREVHHRIKNNLQGVVGLLRQHATKNPSMREPLESAISQVNSMAVVHGLYGQGNSDQIILCEMVKAICLSASGLTGKMIDPPHLTVEVENPIRISDEEAVPMALILNELIFNAVKHQLTEQEPTKVDVQDEKHGALVRIITPAASLPERFDFASGKGLGTGLSLVKSLLPNSGCQLQLFNDAVGVVAELHLSPPVLFVPHS